MLHHFFENAWRRLAGVPEKEVRRVPDLDELRRTEWSPQFEHLMRERLVLGAFRYGLMAEQDYSKYDLAAEAKIRVGLYQESRNLEHLVDAANICLLAYIHGVRMGEELFSVDDGRHTPEREKANATNHSRPTRDRKNNDSSRPR